MTPLRPGIAIGAAVVAGIAAAGAQEVAVPQAPAFPELREVARGRTGSLPKGVTMRPDGTMLVVTNFGQRYGKNISFRDPETLEETGFIAIPGGGNAVESAWSSDGATLYVSDFRNHEILFIDPVEREIREHVRVDHHPKIIALTPDDARLFTSCWTPDSVVAVDTATAEVIGRVELGLRPRGIAVHPDGTRFWVTGYQSGDVHEVDAETLEVRRRLFLEEDGRPRHAVLDRAGERLYVSGKNAHAIFVIDTEAFEVIARVPVGECPKTIALSPDERLLYTANYCSHDVSIVDLASRTERRAPIEDIEEPSGLAVRPDGARIWITGWNSNDLIALEPVFPAAP